MNGNVSANDQAYTDIFIQREGLKLHKTGALKHSQTYTSAEEVKLIRGGSNYFELLRSLINNAKESIHLQVYILKEDETGTLLARDLMAAAERNVAVNILADGYASQGLSKNFLDALAASGVNFRYFSPLLKSKHYYFGRRMHHKIFVADGRHALVGGINISNDYNDIEGNPPWLDFAVYVVGSVARELCILCWKTWNGYPQNMAITPCEKQPAVHVLPEKIRIGIRRNDWVRRKNQISATYIEMFRKAKSEIVLICSYFLPGEIIRKQLLLASRRGVKISIITAGPSDVKVSKYAERWMYDWLLRNNIALYEYQPAILHAKAAVCDGNWCTIGSYNINNISAYASIELNLNMLEAEFSGALHQLLQEIIEKDCIKITEEGFKKTNNLFKQFIRWFSYEFIRVLVYLFTFYFKRKGRAQNKIG